MDGNEIANAFNQQNDKKTWKARAVVRDRKNGLSDVVHFDAKNAMVALEYHVEHNRFAVKFNKFQGAWGDYVKGIARSLYTVLNTLKSAGLPFEAPNTLAGMAITATTTDDNTVYVAWLGEGIQGRQATLIAVDEAQHLPDLRTAVMPELRTPELVENITQALGYPNEQELAEIRRDEHAAEFNPGLPPIL